MHNFMHYDLIIMLTSNSKSISLKHSQNVCRSNFPLSHFERLSELLSDRPLFRPDQTASHSTFRSLHIPEFGRRYFRKFIAPANFDGIKLLNR